MCKARIYWGNTETARNHLAVFKSVCSIVAPIFQVSTIPSLIFLFIGITSSLFLVDGWGMMTSRSWPAYGRLRIGVVLWNVPRPLM